MIGENLLRYNKDQKYIIFDFETESLNLTNAKAWQLSFITFTKDKIIKEYDFFPFWEDLKMSFDAAKITRFDFNSYKSKSCDKVEALDIFESYLYNKEYINVGHNTLNFDIYIHNIYRKLLGRKPNYSYLPRCLDTNCIARAMKNDIKLKPNEDRLAWQFKLVNHRKKGIKTSLGVMAKEFKIDYNPMIAHDGLYDCRVNIEVFKKLIGCVEI